MLDQDGLPAFLEAIKKLDAGFSELPGYESGAPGIERLAYALAMSINPNNHALDGGRATSAMEKEAVTDLAGMYGWKNFLGHLCGGGTMANLEALWVAGQLHPGKKILASEQAHYTHGRFSGVLQLPFETVACDARGRMDAHALAKRLERGDVGTVVATMGTTATGSVDPLPEVLALGEKHRFRVHADAADGGGRGGLVGDAEIAAAEERRRICAWVGARKERGAGAL